MMRRRAVWFALLVVLAVAVTGCSVDNLFGSTPVSVESLELLPGQGEVDPDALPEELPDVPDELEALIEAMVTDELYVLEDDEELDAISALAVNKGATVKKGYIRRGTSFQSPYYVITAAKPGPTLMVVGGVHGNEPSGFTAAERIVRDWRPDRGTLIVITRANAPATARRTRGVSSLPDLNRRFPLGKNPQGQTAAEIYALVKKYRPTFFLDLHEGWDYHITNKKSVGQTVIVYPVGNALTHARSLVSYLNNTAAVKQKRTKRFVLVRNPVSGSLARKVGQDLRIPSAIVETVTKDPLERRVGLHMSAVQFIASKIGMSLR